MEKKNHTVFKKILKENQDNHLLPLQLQSIISIVQSSWYQFLSSMWIFGQKSCFLRPTIFEIP